MIGSTANPQVSERQRPTHTGCNRRGDGSLKLLLELQQSKDQSQAEPADLQLSVPKGGEFVQDFGPIIGTSDAFKRVLIQGQQVAPTDTAILILGETGTGKELLTHAIHSLSQRHDRPLVKVNCAALSPTLIESKLFGHEKRRSIGFGSSRVGCFEAAHGGTIFLDEIGELALELQVKLLRVLEEGECERLGSNRRIRVNTRVIVATSRDLEEAVRCGSFRANLYYRLNAFPIRLPALRERREDIMLLAKFFVGQISQRLGKQVETIPRAAQEALEGYSWPGNVQELKNVIERAVIITQGRELRLLDSLRQAGAGGAGVEH